MKFEAPAAAQKKTIQNNGLETSGPDGLYLRPRLTCFGGGTRSRVLCWSLFFGLDWLMWIG